jgi:type III restriction enzyme
VAAKRKRAANQTELLEAGGTTAPAVPLVRQAVARWREGNYAGIGDTTRALLRWWFPPDGHRIGRGPGRAFRYHPFQREAIETLIYLYEVEAIRRQKSLLETFVRRPDIKLLEYDDFARYCLKMATGSGKTKVISLAVAWQYLNAVVESRDDFARTFLVLAPNVIVYERLRSDFAGGRIFRADPVIPPEFKLYWDLEVYLRGEGERASSSGALYLTNIQQLHARDEEGDEPDPMTAVLGPKPPSQAEATVSFADRVVARGGTCLVVNDEAHHTHDEKLKWNEIIRGVHDRLSAAGGGVAQLDVTATPRYGKGGELFTWTVFDYPLKQAIIDGIVKRPMKGVTVGIKDAPSDVASVKYRAYLAAGVERWREYRAQLAPLGKKPVLFVMMNVTDEADDVAEFLRTKYPEDFAGDKLLVIHTNRSGDIARAGEDEARRAAREVDLDTSPINAIVSVLMLREGWDVQNVTVIVGLRPYSAKANILPEQTLGRGLRLMFRGEGTGYTERVDVIGTKKFMELVDQLERDEDLKLEQFELGKDHLVIRTIAPDPAKLAMDIEVPSLSPVLVRKRTLAEEIAGLDVASFQTPPFPMKPGTEEAKNFRYEGYDVITLEKLVEREYVMPEPQTAQEVISFYAKRIAQEVKLPSQFAALAPKVREFLATRAFGKSVELEGKAMIHAISSNVAQYVTVDLFVKALRALVVEEQEPRLASSRRLSETPPFPYSRPNAFAASKTIYSLAACDNDYEERFARFLQDSSDVISFAKLPAQFGFAIEYTDSAASLRYYEPDFVAVLDDGSRRLIETKGREDPDVAHKDRAARLWCENATRLTGREWRYLKVPQAGFDRLQPSCYADLVVFETAPSTDRSKWPVRVKHLRDAELEDDLRNRSPGERMTMVWPLTVTAWAFKGESVGESRLQRHTVRILRGKS